MSKTYLMGDASLTEEERLALSQSQSEQEEKIKELHAREVQKEQEKKVVTLEMLLQTKINPKEDRVVVLPDPVERVTAGGIIKPDETVERERPLTGTVIAVGPGKKAHETITNVILLNLLQYTSNMEKADLDKLEEKIYDTSIPFKPGDRVLYGRFAGTPVEDPETKAGLLIMRPTDLFATI